MDGVNVGESGAPVGGGFGDVEGVGEGVGGRLRGRGYYGDFHVSETAQGFGVHLAHESGAEDSGFEGFHMRLHKKGTDCSVH